MLSEDEELALLALLEAEDERHRQARRAILRQFETDNDEEGEEEAI